MQSYAAEHGIDMKASFAYADSHSDLPLLEAVGNPVAVRPDVPLYRHARRSHWDVADWASPSGSVRGPRPRSPRMILALEMFRSVPRTVAGKAMGGRMPGILSGFAAPLRLVTIDQPKVDRPGWARLRSRLSGICGSDLGALSGHTSLYFSAVVSLPFVPGHEVVGELLEDCEDLKAGTRVVLDPVLTCAARGVEPCENCVVGQTNRCSRITVGHLAPGAADRVLQGHRWRLGPAAGRAPQPDARGARGLVGRAGAADGAAVVRGAHRAAGRRCRTTAGSW